uniref:Ion transport domain-containing protein n=1 Tax=Stomoxys calcitrans TaxID=35570 RepID=A0A1I8NX31_STOCA
MSNKHHSIEIPPCVMDPQTQLADALAAKNIKDFRVALDLGADPLRLDSNHLSIFDKALRTPGCVEFVEECLQRGCSPNTLNRHLLKYSISHATDSRDPAIIKALLRHPNVFVDKKFNELTPLNSLAKNLNNENANDVIACMDSLLRYGASPNIPNQSDMTPLHHVMRNRKLDDLKKRQVVEMFLAYPELDIDTYREGELREKLMEAYPDMSLPEVRNASEVTFDKLLSYIRCGDKDKFCEQFPQLNKSDKDNLRNTYKEENLPLLLEAIKKGANEAFDLLMDNEVNYNAVLSGNTALEVATTYGNSYALGKLLAVPDLKLRAHDHPLITVIRKMNEQPAQEYCDYRKCFYILLESDRIDINETDKTRSTPLHYAVKYRNTEAIQELLKRGAYIGVKSAFHELPIDGMGAELLEDHFDHCISSNGARVGDESFEILVNFMNLMPEPNSHSKPKLKHVLREEMAPIAFIAKSKEHRYLLQHPLITSFLFLKWHRLSTIFYINFLLYFFFAVSIIIHTVLKLSRVNADTDLCTNIFGLIAWLGIVYMIIRESIQFVMSPVHYFRSPTNYMELALIVLAIMTRSEQTYDRQTQRIIAVFTMLLIAVELCLLVGSLPVLSISTHMLMLEAVCKSFLKSFTLYSIFVVTFTLCFYILFGKPQVDENGNAVSPEDDDFNKFSNPLAALIKTIVMLTGEFDAGDLQFDTAYSYLLFLLFVFLMTIVLFNLLNGLAVSDTQAIKGQAELNGAICRTQLLSRYEEVLTGRSERSSFIVNHEPFRSVCRRLMNLYPNYRHIAILPNDSNKVLIPIGENYEMKELGGTIKKNSFHPLPSHDVAKEKKLLDPPVQFGPCLCSCITNKCSEMDRRTVKLAMAVLEQKTVKMEKNKRQQDTENRLRNIESKMDNILALLRDLKAERN